MEVPDLSNWDPRTFVTLFSGNVPTNCTIRNANSFVLCSSSDLSIKRSSDFEFRSSDCLASSKNFLESQLDGFVCLSNPQFEIRNPRFTRRLQGSVPCAGSKEDHRSVPRPSPIRTRATSGREVLFQEAPSGTRRSHRPWD